MYDMADSRVWRDSRLFQGLHWCKVELLPDDVPAATDAVRVN